MNDWQLLQDYRVRGSEAAFRALTDRHLSLVYSAALRQVNDPQLAEEICQSVFILLARKAGSLKEGIVLSGWFFRTTRFVAARARRAEQRRQRREQEAFEMQQLTASEQAWPRLAPVLDEALAQLGETDRNALLVRFFEGKSHKETGAALGLNEEAARKRVDRALEKLRSFFSRRGVKVSAVVLASALAAHAVEAAPVGLAGSVAATACVGGTAAPTFLPALVREVLSAWQWTKLKLAGSLTASLAMLVGLGIVLTPHPSARPVPAAGEPEPPPSSPVLAASPAPAVPAVRTGGARKAAEQVLLFHVVAKETGEPVGKAQLAVNTVTPEGWRQRYDLVTDATGTAVVPYPPGTGRLDVGVLSWGWGARYATWKDGIPAEYTLHVERVTNSMGGWLRDLQGNPVFNAEITADFDGTGDVSDRETPRERFGFQEEATIARSDAQGWWTCALIPPRNHGGFTLKARHPAFSTTTIIYSPPGNDSDRSETEPLNQLWAGKLVTRLDAGLTLSGRVLDPSGQPVAGAEVAHEPYATAALVVKTDANGVFTFTKLDEQDFDFTVSAPGFAPEYRNVTVYSQTKPLELRLKPGALLRLRVVDLQGEAVPWAQILLEQWGEQRHKLKWSGESGADGRLEWDAAPLEGELELCARKDGWCYSRELRFRADGQEHVLTMQRTLEVSGHVVDAETGQPIPNFKAFPGYGGPYDWERSETRQGTDGKFTVCFQEVARPWRVRVEAEGYMPFVSDSLLPDSTNVLQVALQRLDPTRAVRGVVWGPDRRPVAGAEVALLTLEHSATLSSGRFRHNGEDKLIVKTDAQGRFSFDADPKAHTVVAASADGFARVRLREPGRPLALLLQPWGRIEGVIDAAVRALPIDSVVLSGLDSTTDGALNLGFGWARPDESGRFGFELVPPDTLQLALNPGAGKSFHHWTPVTVAAGQTTSVVITNNGWRVKGRFTLPDGQEAQEFKQVKAYLNNESPPVRPPEGLSGDAAKLWLVDFWNSAEGRQLALNRVGVNIAPAADGGFETEASLPPGNYQLLVFVGNRLRLERKITLAPPLDGVGARYDLGTISLPSGR